MPIVPLIATVNGQKKPFDFLPSPKQQKKLMPAYQRKDLYYQQAKNQGLPSRAAFKIEEILQRFPLVKSQDWVLDLGAAPGGWTVILAKKVGPQGQVLAVDLSAMPKTSHNVQFLQADFKGPTLAPWIQEHLGPHKLSAVFSDLSPKLSGTFFKDAYASYELNLDALKIAQDYLKKDGHFVSKIFPGQEFPDYLKKLKDKFGKVKSFLPKATRKTSREVYVLAMGYQPKPEELSKQ